MAQDDNNISALPEELRTSIGSILTVAETIYSRLSKLVEETPPDLLYHYTNDVGFYGIIQSGELHATDVANLNDPMESTNSWVNAFSVLVNIMKDKTPQHKSVISQFLDIANSKIVPALLHRFVSCFSVDPDDLGQWRAYGDDGRGYVLGFDGQALAHAFERNAGQTPENNASFYVNYDKATMMSLYEELVRKVDEEMTTVVARNIDEKCMQAYISILVGHIHTTSLAISTMFKNESYKNEKEYRLVHTVKGVPNARPEVQYKVRPYELVRYKAFRWRVGETSVLKAVLIGPAADKLKSATFAESCLREFHNDVAPKVALAYSKIPYRI